MSRVSVIAFWFPPSQQVGGKRPLRLANYLARHGHSVTVYAVHPRSPGLACYSTFDDALLGTIDRSICVIRTPSLHGFKLLLGVRDSVRAWRRRQKKPDGAQGANYPSPSQLSSWPKRVVSTVMDWFAVPDPYIAWILTTLPLFVTRSIFARPSAIWVTGPPWSPLILGVLAGKILRIPVHLDFRDPWAQNPYTPIPRVSAALERWSVRNSQSVVANTETMAQRLREAYPDLSARIFAIYNGYDDMSPPTPGSKVGTNVRGQGPLVVLHLGTLYPQRMPQSLAGLLARVAASWTGHRPLRFRFVGLVSDPTALRREFLALGVEDTLECPGQVSSDAARQETAAADVLLLLQLGTQLQVPAKIFEYAFSGKPVLCAADPDSETAVLMTKYNLGKVTTDCSDTGEVLDYLLAVDEGRIQSSPPPRGFLADFNGEELAGRMAQIVLEGGGGGS